LDSKFTKQEAIEVIRFIEDVVDAIPGMLRGQYKKKIQQTFDFLQEAKRQAPNTYDDENQPI
jgi:phage terminase Nu1 subunit (DNA packaging protein)